MSKLQDYLDHNPQLQGDEFIWKKSAAAALEKSEKTLERAANAGIIKAIERKKKIYYLVSDLFKFEESDNTDIQKPVIEADKPRQTPTDNKLMQINQSIETPAASFTSAPADLQERLAVALTEKTEAEAKKAYFEGNITFSLHEAAEVFNLSIVDLKTNAKIFKGKNQKLMITKANLETYLKEL